MVEKSIYYSTNPGNSTALDSLSTMSQAHQEEYPEILRYYDNPRPRCWEPLFVLTTAEWMWSHLLTIAWPMIY